MFLDKLRVAENAIPCFDKSKKQVYLHRSCK
jgi:hypothetical protein